MGNDEVIEKRVEAAPDAPGAYVMKDGAGNVLYVGKATSLRKRLQQHFRGNRPIYGWTRQLYQHAEDIEYIVTRSEVEAFILEATLIKEHNPRYNIRLADDKSYPYIKLTDEMYPRLMLVRDLPRDAQVSFPGRSGGRRFHDPHRHEVHGLTAGRIFGPYPDARSMRRIMRLVSKLFKLRSCRRELDGTPEGRPCLNFYMDRCLAPCRGADVVPSDEYNEAVEQAVRFLDGKSDEIIADLTERMEQAADELDFERAAMFRDRIQAVERVTQSQVIVANTNRDQDVIGAVIEGDDAVVAFLQVRAGRLVKQDQLVFAHATDRSEADVIDAFFTQHYSRATYVPSEILVSEELADSQPWAELLSERRGTKVRVHHPQRGEKRRLTELAVKNAGVGLKGLKKDRVSHEKAARAALGDLADALDLPESPTRIECYDISTTHGNYATGSQVVFTDGRPDKRNYRRYRIACSKGKPDDYAMMAEMLQRRMRRAMNGDPKFLPLPELLVVDGGRGQLSTAVSVLEDCGVGDIPAIGIAKQQEDIFVPGDSEPVDMSEHQAALLLLQRVRDEAHRFAITHHRGLRDSQITKSTLDDIRGIGPARKKALLREYPSVQAISRASVDELAQVEGMNRSAAEAVVRALTGGADDAEARGEQGGTEQ